ncbi:MAG: hypothetical protein IPH52_10045 [Leptospiraceae bacterium]|nr:hypothetical protein [Leptospiraceae bacterium]
MVYAAKTKYKEGKLEKEKIDLLKEIGFDLENDSAKEKLWDENFIELKDQIEKGIFKSADENRNPTKIYGWLMRQKAKHKDGMLEQDKVEKLKGLGVI